MATQIAEGNASISTVRNTRALASDYSDIADFYRKWFTVTYTPPTAGGGVE